MTLSLLISPEARGAYFADYLSVADAELRACFPGVDVTHRAIGDLDFLDLAEGDPNALCRLSFVQGVFTRNGASLTPLAVSPDWALHRDFIFGSKFKGKTNERLTQMLLNVGLAVIGKPAGDVTLLDPMCGRATTLLWAMAYGMRAFGIDEDKNALPDVMRNVRKWAKLTRAKHQIEQGFVAKKNKKGDGAFLDFRAGGTSMRLVQGDAVRAPEIFRKRHFDLIVSDLPYGVQHTSGTSRNPLKTLKGCAMFWKTCLAEGGAVVLAFNRNNPKRKALEAVFADAGWQIADFQAPHRMSESIVRDILIAGP
ncbi:MAG: hypothetical protein AAF891_07355 [Pseudomonadota bacterium]